jgi:Cd2+/Zn2+-exporting ATPase
VIEMQGRIAMSALRHESRYRVSGMDCAACGNKVDTAIRRLPGVEDVAVSVAAGTVKVSHGEGFDGTSVVRQVRNLGYGAEPASDRAAVPNAPDPDGHEGEGHDHAGHIHDHPSEAGMAWWRTRKARLTAACGAALVAAYALGHLVPSLERPAFLAALAVGLVPVAWRAITAARFGTPFSIETLMSIAALGAVFIGAEEEAATVILLFLVGEMLEGVAAGRARASIQGLTALVPKTARLVVNGETVEVPADSLTIGSTILVRPGDRIPADGVVVEGSGRSTKRRSRARACRSARPSAIPSSPARSTRARSCG